LNSLPQGRRPSVPPSEADPGSDLYGYLLGSWSVERTLLDRASGTRGAFTGVVRFSPSSADGGMVLYEEGTLHWPAPGGSPTSNAASRSYLLRRTSAPDTLDVFFADGRPFHRMSFEANASHDQHWCDPDTYQVRYVLEGPNAFRYSWDVQGPAKDLLLESTLRRLGSEA
jgi:Family of unknown function (DUF6314)